MSLPEDEVLKKTGFEIGQDLSEMSVEEIEETLAALNEEIARLETAKNAKSAHLSAAEALFKT